MTANPTGLLIIRAWTEAASSEPLRARIRLTHDVSTGVLQSETMADPDAVRGLVDEWLRGVLTTSGDHQH